LIFSEFSLAEFEHFVDPNDKTHPKFDTIADVEVRFYSAEHQMNNQPAEMLRFSDAIQSKLIHNQTHAYFLGRIYLFFIRIGIDKDRIRFRQHMKNEMAHYASDCWDAECEIDSGWIELVGCADRSCYDLTQHTEFSHEQLVAKRQLAQPKPIRVNEKKINQKIIGQIFRNQASIILEYLQKLSDEQALDLHKKLEQTNEEMIRLNDNEFVINRTMFAFETIEKTIQGLYSIFIKFFQLIIVLSSGRICSIGY